jgi:hypothetical protein
MRPKKPQRLSWAENRVEAIVAAYIKQIHARLIRCRDSFLKEVKRC